MKPDDVEGLRKTLAILHRLADLGFLKQVLGKDGIIRWKATKKKLKKNV